MDDRRVVFKVGDLFVEGTEGSLESLDLLFVFGREFPLPGLVAGFQLIEKKPR